MSRTAFRDLTVAEIQKQLQEARQEVFTLRLQRASGKLQNPARVVQIRRTIARLLTALRQRTVAGGGA
ncbi:MAG TPA: 50S ribosomal protein L29 [bacterium]|nr:50S ribosomal protein L29 [bacterium]